jgi:pilus assembly protein Flp/PilA
MTLFPRRFVRDRSGATAIEYAVIAAIFSAVCLTMTTTVGGQLNIKFTSISNSLD